LNKTLFAKFLLLSDIWFRFIVLYHGTLANKIFTMTTIFLSFLAVILLQMCVHSTFFMVGMSGLGIFDICGVNLGKKITYLTLFYQLDLCLLVVVYGLSLYLGMRVMKKIREHSANVSDGFMVRYLN